MDTNIYVLVATAGLIILHSSQCQPKNTSSILIANLLSIGVATIAFWATGFAFAVGNGTESASNFFLAHTRFFLIDGTAKDYASFASGAIILGLVVVIANSGFVSRLRFWIYPILMFLIAGFFYPCVYHWTNATDGWLKGGIEVLDDGKQVRLLYQDLYGGGYIHIFGGTCSLVGSIMIGARRSRRSGKGEERSFKPIGGNINPLIVLGGLLAIAGLIGKNSNIQANMPGGSLALTNNLLAAQVSGIIAFCLKKTDRCGDPSTTKALINGALAGVVGVSCAPQQYHPYGGFVIGVVSSLAYVVWSTLFHLCRIDDPTDSVAVHLGAGIWAVLAGPMFRKDTGVFYTGTKTSFQTFGWHLLGAVAIIGWTGVTLFLTFLPFVCTRIAKYKDNLATSLDMFEHADPAYPPHNNYTQDEDSPIKDTIMIDAYDNSEFHATVNERAEAYGGWGQVKY